MITMITSACICNISQMFSGEHVQCLSLLSTEWHDVKHTKIGRQHKISWPMIFLPLALFPCHCPTIHLASLWPQELNTVLSLTRSPSLFCLFFFSFFFKSKLELQQISISVHTKYVLGQCFVSPRLPAGLHYLHFLFHFTYTGSLGFKPGLRQIACGDTVLRWLQRSQAHYTRCE